MRRITVSTIHGLLIVSLCLLPPLVTGQGQDSSAAFQTASSVANRYLRTVDKTFPFPSTDGREDFVFVGKSRGQNAVWRAIVVISSREPQVAWDSLRLKDPYLTVVGLTSINAEADGVDEYTVTLRGCAPHQCSDGKIGFAVYASRTRQVYRTHILTNEDGTYDVTFYPQSGMPEGYRAELVRMMCSDNGISHPSALPVQCPTK